MVVVECRIKDHRRKNSAGRVSEISQYTGQHAYEGIDACKNIFIDRKQIKNRKYPNHTYDLFRAKIIADSFKDNGFTEVGGDRKGIYGHPFKEISGMLKLGNGSAGGVGIHYRQIQHGRYVKSLCRVFAAQFSRRNRMEFSPHVGFKTLKG